MTTNYKAQITQTLQLLEQQNPNPKSELNYQSAFQLLVAVILSAQCTDARVNQVTPALFEAFPTAQAMSAASEKEILKYISSISYPNNKARHLLNMAKEVASKFGGEIPSNRELLESLPGVGRKTANVVLIEFFGLPAMPVDTHVFRVAHRLQLVPQSATTPLAVEQHLIKYIDENVQGKAHHWLLLHGRYCCKAINPQCDTCPTRDICPSVKQK